MRTCESGNGKSVPLECLHSGLRIEAPRDNSRIVGNPEVVRSRHHEISTGKSAGLYRARSSVDTQINRRAWAYLDSPKLLSARVLPRSERKVKHSLFRFFSSSPAISRGRFSSL